jgi:hypothetical protein
MLIVKRLLDMGGLLKAKKGMNLSLPCGDLLNGLFDDFGSS